MNVACITKHTLVLDHTQFGVLSIPLAPQTSSARGVLVFPNNTRLVKRTSLRHLLPMVAAVNGVSPAMVRLSVCALGLYVTVSTIGDLASHFLYDLQPHFLGHDHNRTP